MFWEGCLKEGASPQPSLFLPEPSTWGIEAELPACYYVGSLISVPLLLPDYPAEGPHPTPSLSLLGTPVLATLPAGQAHGWVCNQAPVPSAATGCLQLVRFRG